MLSILTILLDKCQTKSFEGNEHFTKRKLPNIVLKIEEGNILFKNECNYLGVYIQTNGTYNKHTNYVSDRGSKRMNILRYVKDTSWGVSKEPMKALYRAQIRSVVEYGMEAYFNPSAAHDISKNSKWGYSAVHWCVAKHPNTCSLA